MSTTADDDRSAREIKESEARVTQMLEDAYKLREEQKKFIQEAYHHRRDGEAVPWRTIAAVGTSLAAVVGVTITATVGALKAFGLLH